jgi:hypothetical protein
MRRAIVFGRIRGGDILANIETFRLTGISARDTSGWEQYAKISLLGRQPLGRTES